MKDYPQSLSEESLDELAKIFPDTAADLRCWKHTLDLADIYRNQLTEKPIGILREVEI